MNIQPSVFVTADTHFGHRKMFEQWASRPENFNEIIVERWNAVVGKNDMVLHLGDLTMTNKEATREITKQLRGRKYLIRGNHDGHSDGWYRDVGFEVIPAAFMRQKTKYEQQMRILFTHEPVQDIAWVDEMAAERGAPRWFNIHGHLHGDSHRADIVCSHHFDCGVDPQNYTPVRISTILNHFKELLLAE